MSKNPMLGERLVLTTCSRKLPRTLSVAMGLLVGLSAAARADIIPPKSYAVTPGGINVADGSLAYSVTDLSIGTMNLERFYRTSRAQPNDPLFGTNFASNFDIWIAANPIIPGTSKSPIVHIGSSASGIYSQSNALPSSIVPNNMDAEQGKLTWSGTQYTYIDNSDASGTIYTFSATIPAVGVPFASQSRKIERIDFADGRRQTFSYNASGYLKLVEDSAGYAMVFDYNASGDVTAACAFNRSQTYVSATSTCAGAQLKATYAYTVTLSRPYLTSATNVLGQATTYTNNNWGMTCVKPPGFATCVMSASNHSTRIGSQTLQDGGTWQTTGMNPDVLNNPDFNYDGDCTNETSITDPNSVTILLSFTKTSPCWMADALGNLTTFHYEGAHQNNDTGGVYSDGTFLKEAIYPEGNKYQAEYLGPFRTVSKETMVPKPGSPLANLVKLYGYGSCAAPGSNQNCAKPIWIRDPNGNQADYTYALHGKMLTELKPAPTAGASRPLKLYSYVQKYAYVKNSGGSLVPAATPIWMLSSETQCQTVAGSSSTTCDTGGPQIVATYQFGADGTANNLLVRGAVVTADGQSRRTCYGYDAYVRKISETNPNANLSVCP